jgi:FkbM family methyltransferase
MRKSKFFGSVGLTKLITEIAPFRCLDIGTRWGFNRDLAPIAWAVDMYGFEPDKAECDRLNDLYSKRGDSTFRNAIIFPVALGQSMQRRTFYVSTFGGTSSFRQPNEVANKFSRSNLVTIKEIRELETVPLDDFLAANRLTDIVFMKLDVEGLELEILQSASNLLSSSLLAIALEVVFLNCRTGGAHYSELETFLRDYHFMPMGFLSLRHWRHLDQSSPLKYIPFSKGQIAHGDMLFFRDPDSLEGETHQQIELLLKAAVLAIIYGYIDHAYYILERPSVKQYLQSKYDVDFGREIRLVSLNWASRYMIRRFYSWSRTKIGLRTRVQRLLAKHS